MYIPLGVMRNDPTSPNTGGVVRVWGPVQVDVWADPHDQVTGRTR